MKRLIITYGDHILYDGEVAQFAWSEDDQTINVTAKQPGTAKPSLAELLKGRSRRELNGSPETETVP